MNLILVLKNLNTNEEFSLSQPGFILHPRFSNNGEKLFFSERVGETHKIGYFNLSQGFVVESKDRELEKFEDRLTRLHFNTGYSASKWSFNLSEYYFHQSSDQITDIGLQRQYDMLSLLGSYMFNSLEGANLQTIRGGFQIRPFDVFGFSILKEHDLRARSNIRSIYQVDFMPNNNCWIINVNYRETVVDNRYSVNWVFNFGNDDFKTYRSNFFRFDRLTQ